MRKFNSVSTILHYIFHCHSRECVAQIAYSPTEASAVESERCAVVLSFTCLTDNLALHSVILAAFLVCSIGVHFTLLHMRNSESTCSSTVRAGLMIT